MTCRAETLAVKKSSESRMVVSEDVVMDVCVAGPGRTETQEPEEE